MAMATNRSVSHVNRSVAHTFQGGTKGRSCVFRSILSAMEGGIHAGAAGIGGALGVVGLVGTTRVEAGVAVG